MRTILKSKFFLIITLIFVFIAIDTFGQYGTSRRVARRTSRRTAARWSGGGYYGGGAYYGGGPAYGAPAPVTTLPGGCVLRAITGINYQYCNGSYYRPYYEGEQVVYIIENPE
jgi:hypothetical protein